MSKKAKKEKELEAELELEPLIELETLADVAEFWAFLVDDDRDKFMRQLRAVFDHYGVLPEWQRTLLAQHPLVFRVSASESDEPVKMTLRSGDESILIAVLDPTTS